MALFPSRPPVVRPVPRNECGRPVFIGGVELEWRVRADRNSATYELTTLEGDIVGRGSMPSDAIKEARINILSDAEKLSHDDFMVHAIFVPVVRIPDSRRVRIDVGHPMASPIAGPAVLLATEIDRVGAAQGKPNGFGIQFMQRLMNGYRDEADGCGIQVVKEKGMRPIVMAETRRLDARGIDKDMALEIAFEVHAGTFGEEEIPAIRAA